MSLLHGRNLLQVLVDDVTELQMALARERDSAIRLAGSAVGVSKEQLDGRLRSIGENLTFFSDNLHSCGDYASLLDICGKVLTSLGIGALGADVKLSTINLIAKLPIVDMVHSSGRHVMEVLRYLVEIAQRESDDMCLSALVASNKILKALQISNKPGDDLSEKFPSLSRHLIWLRSVFATPLRTTEKAQDPRNANISQEALIIVKEATCSMLPLFHNFPGFFDTAMAEILPDLFAIFVASDSLNSQRALLPLLIECQVNTLAFIVHVARSPRAALIRNYDAVVARSCIRLLRACPASLPLQRKEALLSLRTLFSTDVIGSLLSYSDEMCDESVLLGPGRSPSDTLRPLALSVAAEFLACSREKLTPEKAKRLLLFFCRAACDGDLPIAPQHAALRVLASTVDSALSKKGLIAAALLLKSGGSVDSAEVALHLLRISVDKLVAVGNVLPKVITSLSSSDALVSSTDALCLQLVGRVPVVSSQSLEVLVEGLHEIRSVLKTTLLLCRSVLALLSTRQSRSLALELSPIADLFFEEALKTIHLFSVAAGHAQQLLQGASSETVVAVSVTEERDLLEAYAAVVAAFPELVLSDVVTNRLPWLLEAIVVNPQLQFVPLYLIQQQQLSQGSVSQSSVGLLFCEAFLAFSVPRIRDLLMDTSTSPLETFSVNMVVSRPREASKLGYCQAYRTIVEQYGLRPATGDNTHRDVVLRVFRMIFKVLQGQHPQNETLVRPFVPDIVTSCMRVARLADAPESVSASLNLVKYMFRCVTPGGKCVNIYKDFGSYLGPFLRLVVALQRDNSSPELIEAALMVPCRLKQVLPFLPELARSVTAALRSGNIDLVTLGLCTLELWAENLQSRVLEQLLASSDGTLSAVAALLEPPATSVAHTPATQSFAVRGLRLLGKIGLRAQESLSGYGFPRSRDFTTKCQPKLHELHKWALPLPVDHDSACVVEIDPRLFVTKAADLLERFARIHTANELPETEIMAAVDLLRFADPSSEDVMVATGLINFGFSSLEVSPLLQKAREEVRSRIENTAWTEAWFDSVVKVAHKIADSSFLQFCSVAKPGLAVALARSVLGEGSSKLAGLKGTGIMHAIKRDPVDGILIAQVALFLFTQSYHGGNAKSAAVAAQLIEAMMSQEEVTGFLWERFQSSDELAISLFCLWGLSRSAMASGVNGPLDLVSTSSFTGNKELVGWLLLRSGGRRKDAAVKEAMAAAVSKAVAYMEGHQSQAHSPVLAVVPENFLRSILNPADEAAPVSFEEQASAFALVNSASLSVAIHAESLRHALVVQGDWRKDRIISVLVQAVLSGDEATATSSFESLVAAGAAAGVEIESSLLELATKSAVSHSDLKAISRGLELLPKKTDLFRKTLGDRLCERLHGALTSMKDRVSASTPPGTPPHTSELSLPQSGGYNLQWRTLSATSNPEPVKVICGILHALKSLINETTSFAEIAIGAVQSFHQVLGTCLSSCGVDAALAAYMTKDSAKSVEFVLMRTDMSRMLPILQTVLCGEAGEKLREAFAEKAHALCLVESTLFNYKIINFASMMYKLDSSFLVKQHLATLNAPTAPGKSHSVVETLLRILEASTASLVAAVASGIPASSVVADEGFNSTLHGPDGKLLVHSLIHFYKTSTDSQLLASGLRTRCLLRLASVLCVRAAVDYSAVRDFFVFQAPGFTVAQEKRELILKAVDLVGDNSKSFGYRSQLLQLVISPQVVTGLQWDPQTMARFVSVLLAAGAADESLRIEVLKALIPLLEQPPVGLDRHFDEILRFVWVGVSAGAADSIIARQWTHAAALSLASRAAKLPLLLQLIEVMCSSWSSSSRGTVDATRWEFSLRTLAGVVDKIVAVNGINELIRGLADKLGNGSNRKLFEEFGDVYPWVKVVVFLDKHHGALITSHAKTALAPALRTVISVSGHQALAMPAEARALFADVVEVLINWEDSAASELVSNFLVKASLFGSIDASSSSTTAFVDRCVKLFARFQANFRGFGVLSVSRIFASLPLQSPPVSSGDLPKHLRLTCTALKLFRNACIHALTDAEFEALALAIGPALTSTDRAVFNEVSALILCVAQRSPCNRTIAELQAMSWYDLSNGSAMFYKQLLDAVTAGLQVMSGNKGGGLLRHKCVTSPTATSATSSLVPPYLAVKLLEVLLAGLPDVGAFSWLELLEPQLLRAAHAASKELITAATPASFQSSSSQQINVDAGSASFSYGGTLAAPEASVPALLCVLRLLHVWTACADKAGAAKELVDVSSVLITQLAPLVTFATEHTQTSFQVAQQICGVPLPDAQKQAPAPQQGQQAGGQQGPRPVQAPQFTAHYVSALLRHCLGILGRWSVGGGFSLSDGVFDEDEPVGDGLITGDAARLVAEAVSRSLASLRDTFTGYFGTISARRDDWLPVVAAAIRACDGLNHFSSSLGESILRQMFGFVPFYGLIGPPGSCLSMGDSVLGNGTRGLWASSSLGGGLFACAADLTLTVEAVYQARGVLALEYASLGLCSGSIEVADKFWNAGTIQRSAPATLAARLRWLFSEFPLEAIADRNLLPIMVDLLTIPRVSSVRVMWRCDAELCFAVFKCALQAAFDNLVSSELVAITPAVESFLRSNGAKRQAAHRVNVVEALLAVWPLQLPPDLLLYIGRTFGLWKEVCSRLEAIGALPQLREAYSAQGLEDLWFSCVLRQAEATPSIAAVVSHMQQGRWEAAQKRLETMQLTSGLTMELWKLSAQRLAQWPNLLLGSEKWAVSEERAEVASKTQNWQSFREIMERSDPSRDGQAKVLSMFAALNQFSQELQASQRTSSSVDSALASAANVAAQRQKAFLNDFDMASNRLVFAVLAEYLSEAVPRETSLLRFQEFVEAGETVTFLADLRSAFRGSKALPDPRPLLNIWRERIPGTAEPVALWHELLCWRNMAFYRVQELCEVSDDGGGRSELCPYLHDSPWILATYAKLCLKRNHLDAAQTLLGRFGMLRQRKSDVFTTESFEVLITQLKLFTLSDKEADWLSGVAVIKAFNTAGCSPIQISGLLVLSARLHNLLGDAASALEAAQLATRIAPFSYKAWANLAPLLEADDDSAAAAAATLQALALAPEKSFKLFPLLLRLLSECQEDVQLRVDLINASSLVPWVRLLSKAFIAGNGNLGVFARSALLKIGASSPDSVFWALLAQRHLEEVSVLLAVVFANNTRHFAGLSALAELMSTGFIPNPVAVEASRGWEDWLSKRRSAAQVKESLKAVGVSKIPATLTDEFFQKLLYTGAGGIDYLSDVAPGFISDFAANYSGVLAMPLLRRGPREPQVANVKIQGIKNEVVLHVSEMHPVGHPLVPIITLIGDDGQEYCFSIAPCAFSSADGLVAEILWFQDSCFLHHPETRRRKMQTCVAESVAISDNLYLSVVPQGLASLRSLCTGHADAVDTWSQMTGDRLASLREFCKDGGISDTLLKDLVGNPLQFTRSFAAASLLGLVMGENAAERPARLWLFDKSLMLTLDSWSVSNQQVLPLRLTRNVQVAMQPANLIGSLPAALRAAADAVAVYHDSFSALMVIALNLAGVPDSDEVAAASVERLLRLCVPGEAGNLHEGVVRIIGASADEKKIAMVEDARWMPFV